MGSWFDDVARAVASPVPRRRAFKLAAGALAATSVAGVRAGPAAGAEGTAPTEGSFEALGNAIDLHVRNFLNVSEPDRRVRRQVLQDYERAQDIRAQFHETGVIPADSLVRVIHEGDNRIELRGDQRVVIFLSPEPFLEIVELTVMKSATHHASVIFVDGNREFWHDRDPSAKFGSGVFTLPAGENTFRLESESHSAGTIETIGTVGKGAAAGAEAVIVTQMACRKRERLGLRCQCMLSCKPPRGESFTLGPFAIGCCGIEDITDGCFARCGREAQARSTGGITCQPVAAGTRCANDDTCEPPR